MYIFFVVIPLLVVVAGFIFFIRKKDLELKGRVNEMVQNQVTTNANNFLKDYNSLAKKRNGAIGNLDASGVYVLFNTTKQLYYVGQSINVLKRVKTHLTGSGNGDVYADVYADFKYNDNFEVTIHHCNKDELNDIERAFITKYKASTSQGYNKNRGVR